jgi:hypothetical protein
MAPERRKEQKRRGSKWRIMKARGDDDDEGK